MAQQEAPAATQDQENKSLEEENALPQEHPGLYGVLLSLSALLVAVVLGIAYAHPSMRLFSIAGVDFNAGSILPEIAIFYVALSIRKIPTDYHGAAYFYGMAIKRFSPGPKFIPLGLMQRKLALRTVQVYEHPGIDVVSGKKRKTPGDDETEMDPLDSRTNFKASLFFRFFITDIFLFYARFGGNMEAVKDQLGDIGIEVAYEVASKKTVAQFIANLTKSNKKLDGLLTERFEGSGVKVVSARFNSPELPQTLRASIEGKAAAYADSQAKTIRAQGEASQIVQIGEANATARLAMLTAEANGDKKIMDELEVDGEQVLVKNIMGDLAQGKGTTVVGVESGLRDVMGAVAAGKKVVSAEGGAS